MTTTEQLTLDLTTADGPAVVNLYVDGELVTFYELGSWDLAQGYREALIRTTNHPSFAPGVTWEDKARPTGWFGTKQEDGRTMVYEAVVQRP